MIEYNSDSAAPPLDNLAASQSQATSPDISINHPTLIHVIAPRHARSHTFRRYAAISVVIVVLTALLLTAFLTPGPATINLRNSVAALISGTSVIAGSFIIIVAVISLFVLRIRRAWREIKATLCYDNPQQAIEQLLQRSLKRRVPPPIGGAMKQLLARGHAGTSIYVARKDDAISINPFDVPFEPLPLRKNEEAIKALVAGLATSRESAGTALSWRTRIWRIWLNLMPYLNMGFWALIVLMSPGGLSRLTSFYWGGPFTWECAFMTILLLQWVVGPAIAISPPVSWYIAPQRLIMRSGTFRQSKKVTVFDRSDCIIVAKRENSVMTTVHVAGPNRYGAMICDNDLIEPLFRAWLSPVTPPTADRMSDLE